MPDIFSKTKRSAVMAAIRSHGNKTTELRLIEIFRAHGIMGWRRRFPLFGKPDFVFAKEKLAIFVDGCFWHGCPRHASMPKSNSAFWRMKIAGNRKRDREVRRALRTKNWRVLRIWEHDLTRKSGGKLVRRIIKRLKPLNRADKVFPNIGRKAPEHKLRP